MKSSLFIFPDLRISYGSSVIVIFFIVYLGGEYGDDTLTQVDISDIKAGLDDIANGRVMDLSDVKNGVMWMNEIRSCIVTKISFFS